MTRPRTNGIFYRLILKPPSDPLQRAQSPEGRFHHNGQTAFYLSPTKAWALKTMARYVADDDRPTYLRYALNDAVLLDLRKSDERAKFDFTLSDIRSAWHEDRALGHPAPSWGISDVARGAGFNGMIYPSRTELKRWNIVLFQWNNKTGPQLTHEPE
ncbi:RES family NAD+ phosphorylase [Cochlodiniinecator piscidefendens]|uniref:RES family NAD+ phosphorylase n=1 Tax=Cochlodiniinecator piscidefendens TaxID=2715756 RepID=UPI001407491D|nr:RES family NAD+ phosphorylase [Cochlodiniinecator piscidefendens]